MEASKTEPTFRKSKNGKSVNKKFLSKMDKNQLLNDLVALDLVIVVKDLIDLVTLLTR